jgi:hypothetical protein
MFMVKEDNGSFWQNNRGFANNLIKSGCIILALKLTKLAVDVLDL